MAGEGESDIPGGDDGLQCALWRSGWWGVLKGFGVYTFKGDRVDDFGLLECRAKGEGDLFGPNSPM